MNIAGGGFFDLADDLAFFNSYIPKSSVYFEWGTGTSTLLSVMHVKDTVYTLDSNKKYQLDVILSSNLFNHYKITGKLICFNIGDSLEVNNVGRAIRSDGETKSEFLIRSEPIWRKYVFPFTAFNQIKSIDIDLVLIDGRSRIGCALHCFDKLNDEAIILIHDAYQRSYYSILEDYYDVHDSNFKLYGSGLKDHYDYIVESGKNQVKLKRPMEGYGFIALKKKNVPVPDQIFIDKYAKP